MIEHILNLEELSNIENPTDGYVVYVEEVNSYKQYINGEWVDTDTPTATLSLYDLNKSMFVNKPNMDWRKVENVIKKWNPDGTYFLMYGKEIGYFTLFKKDSNSTEKFHEVFKDCLVSIGDLKACDVTDNNDGLEIWIKTREKQEITCLYLFNYDEGVVSFMDNILICETLAFSMCSTLHFPGGETQKVPTAELGSILPVTCNLGGYSIVKFVCDNSSYVEGLISEAKLQEITQYGVNNIVYEIV